NYEHNGPQYVLMDRLVFPNLYDGLSVDFRDGLARLREGTDGYIIAHGIMVHQALKVIVHFRHMGISIGLIDLFRLKPVNKERLFDLLAPAHFVITLEE